MTSLPRRRRQPHPRSARRRIALSRLDAMIDEAIVDAYTESEQAVGFHATLDQQLHCPFETIVLGTTVTVRKIEVTAAGNIVAICYGAVNDRRSRFSSCRCRILSLPDGNGSRPIVDGHE